MMSYAGSIGSLMSGSGLAESLETCYDKNTITHLLKGKVIARTLCGQLLVEIVLKETLMRQFLMINKNLSNTEVEGNSKAQTDRIMKISYMIKLKEMKMQFVESSMTSLL